MTVKRILLECSHTLTTGYNTGIQRVARNVARESLTCGPDLGIECLPVLQYRRRLVDGTRRLSHVDAAVQRGHAGGASTPDATGGWHPWVQRVRTRLRKTFYPKTLVAAGRLAYCRLRGWVITPGPEDAVVFLDGWWNPASCQLAEQARQRGAQVGYVVYDLIPVSHPQFFTASLQQQFVRYLDLALQRGQFFLAISETVQATLRQYAAQTLGAPAASRLITDAFRLGSNLDLAPTQGRVRDAVRQIYAAAQGPAPYLTVGTLEPRKNHGLLLDAFERIWETCPQARLCIVGRVGWLCERLLQRIHGHPRFGRQLHLLTDATDSELAFCYQHARALIFPSHAEGFGLPLVEGLREGLPVLASDIPIHREVGRDWCVYFDISSPASLVARVLAWEQGGALPTVRPWDPAELLDWRASGRQFLEKCLTAASAARPERAEVSRADAAWRASGERSGDPGACPATTS